MIRKFLMPILLSFPVASTSHSAHPGTPGEDAPGGEVVRHSVAGGVELYTVLYLPEGSEKVPAIVLVHGFKSYSQRGGEWETYKARDIAATHGYAALAVTLRGWPDTGGVDDCGYQQPKDIVQAVAWLADHPRIDPDRIALVGGSQGGQVVLLAAAIEPKIKVVVAQFPVVDVALWRENTRLSPGVVEYIDTTCTVPGSKETRSPRFVAGDIEASVLLMHGDADKNVQVEHSYVMYEALKAHDKDVELFIAKGGGHGNMKGPGWEDGERIFFDFLLRKL